jgi:PAS domain S-box-containing protein
METTPQNAPFKTKLSKLNLIEKFTITTCISVSLIIIFGWIMEIENILNLIPNNGNMKFNTALIFLFSGINLMLIENKGKTYKYIYLLFAVISILIGSLTLLQHLDFVEFNINILFIDTMNLGKMSPITALCSLCIGLSFLGFKFRYKNIRYFTNLLLISIVLISLIAIISCILIIPTEHKTFGFNDMPIHTALLFFSIALVLLFKNKNSILHNIFRSQLKGSQVFRRILPLIIIIPIVLANVLLLGINQNWINLDFGIVTYTVILIPISIMYISGIASEFNASDLKRKELEENLLSKNLKLSEFNKALDLIAIVAITDENGIIQYVNDSFCKISKYSRKDLIGQTHKIIKSEHHDTTFFKNMWKEMKEGKIWVGDIKNKAKDGSYYWVDTTIIPFKNEKSEVTGYISIRQDITSRKSLLN